MRVMSEQVIQRIEEQELHFGGRGLEAGLVEAEVRVREERI